MSWRPIRGEYWLLVWTNHSSPGVLSLLKPHSAPQLVDDLDPEAGLPTHTRSVDILWKYSGRILVSSPSPARPAVRARCLSRPGCCCWPPSPWRSWAPRPRWPGRGTRRGSGCPPRRGGRGGAWAGGGGYGDARYLMADVEGFIVLCNIVLISPAACSLHPTGRHFFYLIQASENVNGHSFIFCNHQLKRMSSSMPSAECRNKINGSFQLLISQSEWIHHCEKVDNWSHFSHLGTK